LLHDSEDLTVATEGLSLVFPKLTTVTERCATQPKLFPESYWRTLSLVPA